MNISRFIAQKVKQFKADRAKKRQEELRGKALFISSMTRDERERFEREQSETEFRHTMLLVLYAILLVELAILFR